MPWRWGSFFDSSERLIGRDNHQFYPFMFVTYS